MQKTAGAVVTKSVLPHKIVYDNPAKSNKITKIKNIELIPFL